MARRTLNPFEKAQNAHNRLVKKQPVGRVALLESLSGLEDKGNTLVKAKDMGVIKFAIAMTAANQQALTLNEAGNVQPPLSPEEAATLTAKNDTLQIFIDNDPEAGAQPAPTDPSAIPTSARKGA